MSEKDENNGQNSKIEVEIKDDEDAKQKLREALDRAKKAEEEAEDYKSKLGIIAEKELEKHRQGVMEKARELMPNDEERIKEIEAKLKTPEGVQAMEYTLKTLEDVQAQNAEKSKAKEKSNDFGIPSGSAPLQGQYEQQVNDDIMRHKFNSVKEMIDTVRAKAQTGDTQAQKILDALLSKYIKDKKTNPSVGDSFYDPNAPENLGKLVKKDGLLVLEDQTQGDLGKLVEDWRNKNARVRNARRKMQEGEQ
jgi:hypothetical protein